jgi:hypothetical protein
MALWRIDKNVHTPYEDYEDENQELFGGLLLIQKASL